MRSAATTAVRRAMKGAIPMRVIALTMALVLAGCSLVLVKGPTTVEQEPTTWPVCTEHYFWELVDAAIAGLAFGGAVYFSKHVHDEDAATVGLIVESGMAIGFGVSALSGLGKTGRCRKARDAYERAAEQGR